MCACSHTVLLLDEILFGLIREDSTKWSAVTTFKRWVRRPQKMVNSMTFVRYITWVHFFACDSRCGSGDGDALFKRISPKQIWMFAVDHIILLTMIKSSVRHSVVVASQVASHPLTAKGGHVSSAYHSRSISQIFCDVMQTYFRNTWKLNTHVFAVVRRTSRDAKLNKTVATSPWGDNASVGVSSQAVGREGGRTGVIGGDLRVWCLIKKVPPPPPPGEDLYIAKCSSPGMSHGMRIQMDLVQLSFFRWREVW